MQMKGETLRERIACAAAFAKAHRSGGYDSGKAAEIYGKAGVPFTAAADGFWREWLGVWDGIDFYPDRPNVEYDDGESYIKPIDFWLNLFDDPEMLRLEYAPGKCADGWADIAGILRSNYGDDAVPVAEGGYYYPDIIWVCPDGRLLSVFPDEFDEIGDERVWESLEDFICAELKGENPRRVEKVVERRELEGSLEERIAAAIVFARSHGGFARCRMTTAAARCDPLDIKRLCAEDIPEDELPAIMLQLLKEQTPGRYDGIIPPGRICCVEE